MPVPQYHNTTSGAFPASRSGTMLESSVNATRLYRSQAAKLVKRGSKSSRLGTILAPSAAALAAAAVYNTYRTRKAEHDHPPSGEFVTVDGVWLHYLEKGEGPPV